MCHSCLRTFSLVFSLLFMFCFLHVQFCKANSRYCISQLICLQRKLTVSGSAMILHLWLHDNYVHTPPSTPDCFSPKSFASWAALAQPSVGMVGMFPVVPKSYAEAQIFLSLVLLSLLVSVLLSAVCLYAVTPVSCIYLFRDRVELCGLSSL